MQIVRRLSAAVLSVSAAALLFTTAACSDTPATEPVAPSAAPTAPTNPPGSTDTPDPTDSVDLANSAEAQQAEYASVLLQFGAAVELAPAEVLQLGDAAFCGWDEVSSPPTRNGRVDVEGRECFLAAHRAGRAAVFVNQARDNEGLPMPNVLRTEAGQATISIDWTRSLSSATWTVDPCPTLYVIEPAESGGPLSFACYPTEGAQPA